MCDPYGVVKSGRGSFFYKRVTPYGVNAVTAGVYHLIKHNRVRVISIDISLAF